MAMIALGKRARKHKGLVALVDDEDFEKISAHNWYASYSPNIKKYYAQRQISDGEQDQKSVRMHRVLTGAKAKDRVVHLNGDTLDNRRENLRVVEKNRRDVDDKI